MNCPCGNTKKYEECCAIYHTGKELAPTAELLMRSRYTAFAKKQLDYIKNTIHPQNIQDFNQEANREWAESADFTSLEILRAEESGNKGIVEFKANYTVDGEEYLHHEVSTFRKQSGQWYFKTGKVIDYEDEETEE